MALDLLQISFPLNILRTNGQILTKLYITIYTDKIYVGIVSCHFSQICKRVMASDFIWDFGKLHVRFPEHLGIFIIKIWKISAKIHEIRKIKVIFGLGMTPI